MTERIAETSPSARARLLAALYLFVIVAGISGQALIADRLVAGTDAARTAAAILANTSLYRLGFTIFMHEMVAQASMSAPYYDLMKPVNRSAARVSLILGLTGCGIKTLARLFYYAPLILLGGASYLAAIQPAELDALSLASIKVGNQWAAIAGAGWLTFLWPPLGSRMFVPVALFAIAGSFATIGWLFVRGVDDVQWRARAALAATSIWR